MKLLHPGRHGALEARDGAFTMVETALERELHLLPLLVDLGPDDEQAVGAPECLVTRGVSASDGDSRGRLVENLEVVSDLGALVIVAGRQVLVRPKLLRRLRATPLPVQIPSLNHETCSAC